MPSMASIRSGIGGCIRYVSRIEAVFAPLSRGGILNASERFSQVIGECCLRYMRRTLSYCQYDRFFESFRVLVYVSVMIRKFLHRVVSQHLDTRRDVLK